MQQHRGGTATADAANEVAGSPGVDRAASAGPGKSAGLGLRMARGAVWTVAMRFSIRILGLISTLVLARLLMPEDFGLVAMATMIIAALEVMSEFGFNIFLIASQTADREDYDTAWTLSVIRGVAMLAVISALASPAAQFFNDARLEGVFYWLAIGSAIVGFQNIGIVDFQKNLDMHKDFILEVSCKVCAVAVGVGFALWWRNYWALVAGTLTLRVTRVALSYVLHPYRPRFHVSRWRHIWGFSKWLVLDGIILFIYNRSDTFVLGKLLNAQAVGVYAIAHEIANLTTTELVMPIRRALLPGFAQVAGEEGRLRRVFLESLALTVMVGTPLAAGTGLVAEPLVRLALGEKWLQAIALIEILAIYGLLHVVSANLNSMILALRRPALIAILSGGTVVVMLPLLVWGTREDGAHGAAIAVTIATGLGAIAYFATVMRLMEVAIGEVLERVWRTGVAATLMTLAVIAMKSAFGSTSTLMLWAEFASCVACGAVVYIASHLGLWVLAGRPRGAETRILELIRSILPFGR